MTRKKSERSDTKTAGLAHEDLTREIIGAFYTVYNELGYGFAEAIYANAISYELETRELAVRREVPFEVHYLGEVIGQYRVDLMVNETVVVELKAGEAIGETERRQLLNYLCVTGLPVGLLFHFGPKPWFKRMVGRPRRPDQTLRTRSASS
jgi:GxxExxY protein